MKQKPSITIGIPTCYGGESLVETVRSIRNAKYGKDVHIIITADRTPFEEHRKKKLKRLGVEFYWNKKEGSQFKKIKQMVEKCKSDLYVATQDDVTFSINTIKEIVDAFENDASLTMAGIRILPLKPVTFFESAMTSMLRITDTIAGKWNGSSNHLSASGRCLAFQASHIKKFRIPEAVVNGDMFFFLENKRLKGTFRQLRRSVVYIRCPQQLQDQMGPSSRYQYSSFEMQRYFDWNTKDEYKIPLKIVLLSFVDEFLQKPVPTAYYMVIGLYTRIKKLPGKVVANPIWEVDSSTKSVKVI